MKYVFEINLPDGVCFSNLSVSSLGRWRLGIIPSPQGASDDFSGWLHATGHGDSLPAAIEDALQQRDISVRDYLHRPARNVSRARNSDPVPRYTDKTVDEILAIIGALPK